MSKMKSVDDLMTVGELREHLKAIPDDARIFFGCYGLEFCRVKWRGENLVQIEFNQSVYDDEHGNVIIDNHD